MNGISDLYRELSADELKVYGPEYDRAWQHETMPQRQFSRVVAGELSRYRAGEDILPYCVGVECVNGLKLENPTLLDVGASSAYYNEVFRLGGVQCRYTACDYSESYYLAAKKLYPDVVFDIADATSLPYQDAQFDIVFHSACLMHVREYRKAIFEAARVASRFVIFHRTPIQEGQPTRFFSKEAYGVPCCEVRFNHDELFEIFQQCGLSVIKSIDLFTQEDGFAHRSYVCEKGLFWHPV